MWIRLELFETSRIVYRSGRALHCFTFKYVLYMYPHMDQRGMTALQYACAKGHLDCARFLVNAAGIDPRSTDAVSICVCAHACVRMCVFAFPV